MSKKSIATAVSEVFSPFVLGGLLLTFISVKTSQKWLFPVGIQLIFIIGIPLGLSLWMSYTGRVTDRFVQVRHQRTPLYLITLVSWFTGTLLINLINTTREVQLLTNLFSATLVIVTLLNLKIKVSIHALASALFAITLPMFLALPWVGWVVGVMIWAVTVWSRYTLKRHSGPELFLGTCVGAALSFLYWYLL